MNKKTTTDNKQLPYEAPYGYFEHLENRTLRKITAEQVASPRWLPLFMQLGAAALVLLFGWVIWQQQLGQDQRSELQQVNLAEIEAEDRLEYLLTYGDRALLMSWVEASEVSLSSDWTQLEVEADDLFESYSSTELEQILLEL